MLHRFVFGLASLFLVLVFTCAFALARQHHQLQVEATQPSTPPLLTVIRARRRMWLAVATEVAVLVGGITAYAVRGCARGCLPLL